MDKCLELKIRRLGQLTRDQFALFASVDPKNPEDIEKIKTNSIEGAQTFNAVALLMNLPGEVARSAETAFEFIATYCEGAGSDAAALLRECLPQLRAIRAEMDLPEGTCPTAEGVKAAAVKTAQPKSP